MHSKVKILSLVTTCLLSASLWSCQKLPFFNFYTDLDNQNWDSGDTIRCTTPEALSDEQKEIHLNIRFTDQYQYRNLCLGVRTYDNNRLLRTDTVKYELFTETGKRNGDGVVFAECKGKPLPIQIRSGHTYSFRIFHVMRQNPLKGISNVSLRIED